MEIQKNEKLFLNFLKSRINRNIEIFEGELIGDFSAQADGVVDNEYNKKIFKNIYFLDYLSPYILDTQVNEIIVHDFETVQIEKNGFLSTIELKNLTPEIFLLSLETLVLRNKVIWNYSTPFASFYIQMGLVSFRCSIIHESCGIKKKPKLFLRRIKNDPFSLTQFKIPEEIESRLKSFVGEKKNILIAGSAGSGKSSLLATLLNEIPENQHVIILEDTHEIPISKKNFTYFLGNDVLQHKTLKDFCTFSLRLRPDRISLGEIRSDEIIPFILAMNTGHRGMMSTIHSDSAQEAITRMAILFLMYGEGRSFTFEMALKLISKNIDIVIYLKDKKIVEIIKVIGSERGIINYDYYFRNNLS